MVATYQHRCSGWAASQRTSLGLAFHLRSPNPCVLTASPESDLHRASSPIRFTTSLLLRSTIRPDRYLLYDNTSPTSSHSPSGRKFRYWRGLSNLETLDASGTSRSHVLYHVLPAESREVPVDSPIQQDRSRRRLVRFFAVAAYTDLLQTNSCCQRPIRCREA